MMISFGRYKGEDIVDLPTYYLKWIIKQTWVKKNLQKQIKIVLHNRDTTPITEDKRAKEKKKIKEMLEIDEKELLLIIEKMNS